MIAKRNLIKRYLIGVIVIAIVLYLIFAVWFHYQVHQVNALNVIIKNESDLPVTVNIQIFDSQNNSVYQNNVTIDVGSSFKTGEIVKKADRYHFVLTTNTGLTFDNYTNVDEGFHSPEFIITNSNIEIYQIVE